MATYLEMTSRSFLFHHKEHTKMCPIETSFICDSFMFIYPIPNTWTVKMVAAHSSGKLVTTKRNIWFHSTQNSHLNTSKQANLWHLLSKFLKAGTQTLIFISGNISYMYVIQQVVNCCAQMLLWSLTYCERVHGMMHDRSNRNTQNMYCTCTNLCEVYQLS
jgi:hypothetical protein